MAAVAMVGYRPHAGYESYPQQYAGYQSRPSDAPRYAGYESTAQPQRSSPVREDSHKPLLPSISNLIGIADGEKPNRGYSHHSQSSVQRSPPQLARLSPPSQRIVDERRAFPYSSQIDASRSQPRTAIPPTPSLSHDSLRERRSPSAMSNGSAPHYLATSAPQANDCAPPPAKRRSIASQPGGSTYGAASYTTSPYATSPGSQSNASFYSAGEASSYPHYSQQPLPSSFPPAVQQPLPPIQHTQQAAAPLPAPQAAQQQQQPGAPNPWEHHHYISPSASNVFAQNQDRYICATCNKAFSRPSSLKIHSHSHTGEKPFKCPQVGCGKAFSVRSNMKRHERGCHAGMTAAVNGPQGMRML